MKDKTREILEKIINFSKNNWKKIAIIAGVVIIVVVLGLVLFGIRANNIKNSVKEQLNGKTFESFEDLGNDMWTLDGYTFQEDGKYINDEYYYYGSSNIIEHKNNNGTANIKVSLFGKVTFSVYEIILNNGEIEALKSSISDDIYEIVEVSNLQKIAVDVFCELTQWRNTTYGEMIDIIYKDYDVTCTAVEGSDTKYVLTFDGYYYPNKRDIPNYTEHGVLSVEVDIATKTGKILKDQGITTAMDVYVVLGYSW